MTHALTIDVEDTLRITSRNLAGEQGPPSDAVVRNTERMLAILASRQVRATCFVLGEVAEAFPELLRSMVKQGHEIGVHGYHHYEVHRLRPEEFRREIHGAKRLIEDLAGCEVRGHRAPTFSITSETRWAFDILAEEGFQYDSSVYPFAGDRYGWPDFPLHIHRVDLADGRRLIEAPMSVVSVLGKRLPACGGGYLRHFPYWYTQWAIRRIGRERPAVVYFHPWEIDTSPLPDWFKADMATVNEEGRRFVRRLMRNRDTVEEKLTRLIDQFQFAPLGEVIEGALVSSQGP